MTTLHKCDDETGFLSVFWLVQSTLCTPDDWERLAFESIFDGAQHELRYCEAFFTPARHLAARRHLGDVVSALDRRPPSGERETGTTCTLIFDIDRDSGLAVAEEPIA